MGWTTPRTWMVNDLVDDAGMNVDLRDNLNYLKDTIDSTPEPSTILFYLGSTAPTGWLLCDGSAVSRTTYEDLFDAIGTTYGSGDGSTTFNLPDLRGRSTLGLDNMGGSSANRVTATEADTLGGTNGAETHTLTVTEMPSHTHTYGTPSGSGNNLTWGTNWSDYANAGTQSTGSAGSNGAHNNMQPYLSVNFIIKA